MSRNRKLVNPQGSRWGKAGVMVLVLLVAGFIISSLVWAWTNLQQTTLNYQISQAQETQKQYLLLNRRLHVEHSSLTSIRRLEKLAVEQFDMGPPQPGQVVQLP